MKQIVQPSSNPKEKKKMEGEGRGQKGPRTDGTSGSATPGCGIEVYPLESRMDLDPSRKRTVMACMARLSTAQACRIGVGKCPPLTSLTHVRFN